MAKHKIKSDWQPAYYGDRACEGCLGRVAEGVAHACPVTDAAFERLQRRRLIEAVQENTRVQAETLQFLRTRDALAEDERRGDREERRKEIADRKTEAEAQMAALGRFSGSIRAGLRFSGDPLPETPELDTRALLERMAYEPCLATNFSGLRCGRQSGHAGGHVSGDGEIGWGA